MRSKEVELRNGDTVRIEWVKGPGKVSVAVSPGTAYPVIGSVPLELWNGEFEDKTGPGFCHTVCDYLLES